MEMPSVFLAGHVAGQALDVVLAKCYCFFFNQVFVVGAEK